MSNDGSYTYVVSWTHACKVNDNKIVPILKNRQGDTSDKNNYRPIAIVMALSKIALHYEKSRNTVNYQ